MSENKNMVSVITPAYNALPCIERCVESVAHQVFEPGATEMIVVDDGSTDGTSAIVDRLAARHPNLLRVIHQENSGSPSGPRNLGLDLANGRYVFLSRRRRLSGSRSAPTAYGSGRGERIRCRTRANGLEGAPGAALHVPREPGRCRPVHLPRLLGAFRTETLPQRTARPAAVAFRHRSADRRGPTLHRARLLAGPPYIGGRRLRLLLPGPPPGRPASDRDRQHRAGPRCAAPRLRTAARRTSARATARRPAGAALRRRTPGCLPLSGPGGGPGRPAARVHPGAVAPRPARGRLLLAPAGSRPASALPSGPARTARGNCSPTPSPPTPICRSASTSRGGRRWPTTRPRGEHRAGGPAASFDVTDRLTLSHHVSHFSCTGTRLRLTGRARLEQAGPAGRPAGGRGLPAAPGRAVATLRADPSGRRVLRGRPGSPRRAGRRRAAGRRLLGPVSEPDRQRAGPDCPAGQPPRSGRRTLPVHVPGRRRGGRHPDRPAVRHRARQPLPAPGARPGGTAGQGTAPRCGSTRLVRFRPAPARHHQPRRPSDGQRPRTAGLPRRRRRLPPGDRGGRPVLGGTAPGRAVVGAGAVGGGPADSRGQLAAHPAAAAAACPAGRRGTLAPEPHAPIRQTGGLRSADAAGGPGSPHPRSAPQVRTAGGAPGRTGPAPDRRGGRGRRGKPPEPGGPPTVVRPAKTVSYVVRRANRL
ncbi:glycosyltransferase family 2 protein [Streptomyces sp. GKU 257-1]|nr:glycosyltransferase family 2 protein [Streptomyces sp. GKU 257-1]